MLTGRRVVLGVTGGIAAYKAADLASRLVKAGAQVRVVMTENARRFVAPLTFEALTGQKAAFDAFERAFEIEHVALAKWAELFIVAPATANFLGKYAGGIADDLLTSVAMAMPCPALIAPAMNTAMYRAPATQDNLALLARRGARFVGPESGRLACGDDDVGRMSEPAAILRAAEEILSPKRDFEGRHVLVTAGPTREMLDPVRFLSNCSTGKMGYAVARAALERGARVTLVTGPVSIEPPKGAEVVSVVSTADLYREVTQRAPECDAVIQAAAPADFTPETVSDTKIKKKGVALDVHFIATPDVARALGEAKRAGQVLVAFAAETGDPAKNARGKRLSKNADLIVANDVTAPGAGFAVDTNRVLLIDDSGEEALPLMSKRDVAEKILDRVAALLVK